VIRYTIRRILISIPVLVLASFLCFALVTAMGDPLGEWKSSHYRTPESIAHEEQTVGYDQPFFERYGTWAADFVKGDWRTNVVPGDPDVQVKQQIGTALWITIKLVLLAEVAALIIGVVIGVISAVRQYSIFDYSVTGIAFVLFAMPLFCIALMLKVGGIQFNNWLQSVFHLSDANRWIITAGPPPGGFAGSFFHQLYQYSGAYVLPGLSLIAIELALYSRFQRASMLETLNADYVRTAQAKGISQARVVLRHAFRNALIPVVTVAAIQFGAVFSGAIITETVFNWHGMGKLIVDAVSHKEPWMVQGWLMVTAICIIVFNLIADVLYAFLDPRIRLD
jgi:ABC-type dipeptide/oligopeptide/nickel transport system permease component